MHWISLVLWIGLCFVISALGARWTTAEIPTWYRTLEKPSFNPPSWIFAPVWTTLYLLMAIAAWRVSQTPGSLRVAALNLFLAQLALNLAWSWIFFHRHAIGVAAIEIFVLWAAIGAATLTFSRIDPPAAWLMTPYWAWVTFAMALNAAIWHLNRAHSSSARLP